jgi:hypothetical protein
LMRMMISAPPPFPNLPFADGTAVSRCQRYPTWHQMNAPFSSPEHIDTHTRTDVYTHIYTDVYMHIYTDVYMHIHTDVYMH